MIKVVDYGLGNIKAFENLYISQNIEVGIAKTHQELVDASKIILPGVGAFDQAMELLNKSGMRNTLDMMVLERKTPILGVCIGMQMFANNSQEGVLDGLGYIDASVIKIDSSNLKHKPKLPHMGWNNITHQKSSDLLKNIDSSSRFYFLHSYCLNCNFEGNILCTSYYGITFPSVVNYKNIFGVQFHPEKSHSDGVQLLVNFARI